MVIGFQPDRANNEVWHVESVGLRTGVPNLSSAIYETIRERVHIRFR